MVSAEFKVEYMTLQGRLQDYSLITAQKLKVISSSFELDVNVSQACSSNILIMSSVKVQLNSSQVYCCNLNDLICLAQ